MLLTTAHHCCRSCVTGKSSLCFRGALPATANTANTNPQLLRANHTPLLPGVWGEASCPSPSSLLLILFHKPKLPFSFPIPGPAQGDSVVVPGGPGLAQPCARTLAGHTSRPRGRGHPGPGAGRGALGTAQPCCSCANSQSRVNSPQTCCTPSPKSHSS